MYSSWGGKELDTTEQRNFIEIYGFSCISNATPPFAHCGSVIKNLSINAGDTRDMDSIPGSGRFSGEGIGYPLHYSWASFVAQLVKKPRRDVLC